MPVIAGALIVLVILALGGLAAVYSGVYNIAADYPHSRFAAWLLRTTMQNSVARYADRAPQPPENLAALAEHGFRHYRKMCVVCHGAPGVERGEIGKGLRPQPPSLAHAASHWSDRELFWIIKHGIRLTGMPAWGETHGDREIWAITAFVRTLPSLSPEEYRALTKERQ